MKVVYVSHNGLATALVRSQVLPYLRRLAARGVEITLVTYERERAAPTATLDVPRAAWIPLRARQGSGLIAKAVDIMVGVIAVARAARGADLIHARSYVPALVAWLAGRIVGTPFLFDMRGFLPEEYLDAGHWREGELRHRALRAAEGLLLRAAAEIVVLTEAAKRRLLTEPRYARAVGRKTITVIPCAVELERFAPSSERAREPTLVYSGSLGMWYLLDEMIEVFQAARRHLPGLRLLILNRSERALIESSLARHGLAADAVEVRAVDFADMPAQLARAHAGIALLRQSPSKSASSPIKIAEYLACGLPVVVNAGLGDTDLLVERYAAGHVVRSYDDAAIAGAGAATARLVADEAARRNARALAEAEYDADAASDRYSGIYSRLATSRRRAV